MKKRKLEKKKKKQQRMKEKKAKKNIKKKKDKKKEKDKQKKMKKKEKRKKKKDKEKTKKKKDKEKTKKKTKDKENLKKTKKKEKEKKKGWTKQDQKVKGEKQQTGRAEADQTKPQDRDKAVSEARGVSGQEQLSRDTEGQIPNPAHHSHLVMTPTSPTAVGRTSRHLQRLHPGFPFERQQREKRQSGDESVMTSSESLMTSRRKEKRVIAPASGKKSTYTLTGPAGVGMSKMPLGFPLKPLRLRRCS